MNISETSKFIRIETQSKLDWQGLKSLRFPLGRKHFNIGEQSNGPMDPDLGRRHFEEKYDKPLPYKPCLKVYPKVRNIESQENRIGNKLIYVPAQKRSKPFKIKTYNVGLMKKNNENNKLNSSDKLNWKEREKINAYKEDAKSVNELILWEQKILKVFNPLYDNSDE